MKVFTTDLFNKYDQIRSFLCSLFLVNPYVFDHIYRRNPWFNENLHFLCNDGSDTFMQNHCFEINFENSATPIFLYFLL